jgi:hypothetical protein
MWLLYWLVSCWIIGIFNGAFQIQKLCPGGRKNIAKDDVTVTILRHCPIGRLDGHQEHEKPERIASLQAEIQTRCFF